MLGFVLGVVAGGVAAFCWRDRISRYLEGQPVRDQLADRVHRLQETISAGLRGSEQWLRSGKTGSGNGAPARDPESR